jgi:molybdenum cofactor cytidylyltransferase
MSQTHRHIIGILLAAGKGSRFGGDKLLQPLADGVAIAAHAARNLLAGVPDEVIAVVRWDDIPLADLLEQEGCQVSRCRTADRGMSASLAHGIEHAGHADGWVIALADMPLIRPETIRRVAAALAGGARIAAPVYRGERGHPVGFAMEFRSALMRLTGDTGARAILDQNRDAVQLVECDDPGIHIDIDRPSDLAELRNRAAK